MSSLAKKTAQGLGWLVFWRAGTRVMGLCSTLILVRLLSPDDFGIIALALSVTQAVELLSLLGIEDALVRHPSPDKDVYDTAFTLNAIRGAFTAGGLLIAAWPAAIFFREPRLVIVIAALGGASLLGCLENIGMVDFRRNLAYSFEFKLRIIPRIISSVATVAAAWILRDFHALLVGIVLNKVISVVLSYTMHPHRPRFTLSAWRDLAGFSIWVWLTAMVAIVQDRVEIAVVGRMIGLVGAGVLSIAGEVAILPLTEFMQPLARVLFSAYSRVRDDLAESARLFHRFLGLSALLSFPAGTGIALLADPMTHGVLGTKWLEAVPVIQLIAVGSGLTTLFYVGRPLLEVHGWLARSFQVTVVGTVLRVTLVVIGCWYLGLIGAVMGTVATMIYNQVTFLGMAYRLLHVSPATLWRHVWRPLLGCGVMAAVLIGLGLHRAWPEAAAGMLALEMVTGAAAGAASYGVVVLVAWVIAGRPNGAEADMLLAAEPYWRRLRPRRSPIAVSPDP